MKHKKRVLILITLLSSFFIAFLLGMLFKNGYLVGGEFDYFITYILMFFFLFWGISIIYRTQFSKVRTIMILIVLTSFLWIALRFMKWLPNIEQLSIYIDYAFNIPMMGLPLLFLIINIENYYPNLKRKKVLYTTLLSIYTILILFALTNNLHHFVYNNYEITNPIDNPKIVVIKYSYGIMNYVILAYSILLLLFGFFILFLGVFKRLTIKQAFTIGLLISLYFTYLILYTIGLSLIRKTQFLKDFALMNTIFLYSLLELTMYFGFIQNSGRYVYNFKRSMLPIGIYDEGKNLLYRSESYDEIKYLTNDPNYLFKEKSIGEYKIIIEENLSEIIHLQDKIKKENDELLKSETLLRNMLKVNSMEKAINFRISLTTEIKRLIDDNLKEVHKLSDSLPNRINTENYNECKRTMKKTALLLAYMKQKCLLVLQAKERQTLSYQAFNLILDVIKNDIKVVDFNQVAINLLFKEEIDIYFATLVNDFINDIVKEYSFKNVFLLIIINPNTNQAILELSGIDEIKEIKNYKWLKTEDGIRYIMEVHHE